MNNIHSLTGENCTVTFQIDNGHILVGRATIEEARTCPDRWAEDWSVKLRGWRKMKGLPSDKWIREEDELPEPLEAVLVWIPDAGRIIGRWLPSRGEWKGSSGYYYCRAGTHWMPLPNLPKREGPFYIRGFEGPAFPAVYHEKFGYICIQDTEEATKLVCKRLNLLWGACPPNSP